MAVETKHLSGGLNVDDSVELIDPKDWSYARNIVSGRASDGGEMGFIENIKGTNTVTQTLLELGHECIGVIRSRKRGDAFLFYYHATASKNKILKYSNGTLTNVLTSDVLKFDPDYRITGGGLAGNLLFFTDGLNEPRCVHTTRYSDGTTTPKEEDITLVKRPPVLPLEWSKHTTEDDASAILSDNVQYDDFQFAYQYFYKDKQYSVLSPFSSLVNKNVDSESYKRIRLTIPDEEKIPALVDRIKLCARKGNTGNWFYIGELKRFSTDETTTFATNDGNNDGASVTTEYGVTHALETDVVKITGTADLVPHEFVRYIEIDPSHSVDIKIYLPSSNVNTNAIQILDSNGKLTVFNTVDSWVTITPAITNGSAILHFVMKNTASTTAKGEIFYDASVDSFYIASIRRYSTNPFRKVFDFYNTNSGAVIPNQYTKPFDAVPLTAAAMEVIKSRVWLGNFTEGYDKPDNIDLVVGVVNTSISSTDYIKKHMVYSVIEGKYEIKGFYTDSFGYKQPVLALISKTDKGYHISDNGLYYPVDYDPDFPNNTINITGTGAEFRSYSTGDGEIGDYYYRYDIVQVDEDVPTKRGATATPEEFDGEKSFSNNSSYQVGILFSDFAGRKCTVYTKDSLRVDIPEELSYSSRITWKLLSDAGIPGWADTYSIVLSKNLRKRYYIEHKSLDIFYSKTDTDGNETTTTTYSPNYQYIKIDVSGLIYAGLGYEYGEGDRIFVRNPAGDGKNIDLPVVAFDGQYILCDNKDIGSILNNECIFEIYKPLKGEAETLFYEIGQTYKIINNSEYTLKAGVIEGDSVNITRPTYTYSAGEIVDSGQKVLFKAVSIDGRRDDFQWNTDAGRGFVAIDIGQTNKEQYFKHSGVYIADTEINGLSEFEALDEAAVPIENGAIKKLQSTKRVSTEGDVLLALCENEVSSIYIGELQMNTQDNTSFFISTSSVIGEVRTQRGGFGTTNPESVVEYEGYVYWYATGKRAFVRYATNGIFPISEKKAVDYFEDQGVFAGATDKIVCGVDPFYKTVFVTFSAASSSEKKTIGWSLTKERWEGFYDFAPDYYVEDIDKMVSLVGENVHTHDNATAYCNFYGSQYNVTVDLSFNQSPQIPKEWRVIQLQVDGDLLEWSGGNQRLVLDGMDITFTNRFGQSTNLLYDEFECDENMVYGDLMNDSNSPGGLLMGEPMYSPTLQAKISTKGSDYVKMMFVVMKSNESIGHSL